MATTKLTLSIDTDTIERAKKYVHAKHTSLSKLVQNYLNDIAKQEANNNTLPEKLKEVKISDDIKSLTGILKGKYPDAMDYKDMRYEYLKQKHGL